MTTLPAQLEQKEGVNMEALIESIKTEMALYWRFCTRATFERGDSAQEIKSEQFFTVKNPLYARLVQTFADAIKASQGAEIYSAMELLSQLDTLFDGYARQYGIRSIFLDRSGEFPQMTGERFVQLLRQDIDKYWAEKIAKSQSKGPVEDQTVNADIAAEQADIGKKVERTLAPKLGLRALNFAVVDSGCLRGDYAIEEKLGRALCEGMGKENTRLPAIPNVQIRAGSVEHTLDAINCYTDPHREPAPPIDIIFIGSQIKGEKDDELSDWHSIGLLGALDQIKSEARYAPYLKGAKVVVLRKKPDDEFRRDLMLFDHDDLILGYLDMSDEPTADDLKKGHGISLATRLIGLLADKGIVEPDFRNADAQLKLHTNNFNREARAVVAKHGAANQQGKDFWANEPMLMELLELINKYRAAEGLSDVELHTEGPHQYTIIVSTLHVEKYVKPELLLAEKVCPCAEIMRTIRDIMDDVPIIE